MTIEMLVILVMADEIFFFSPRHDSQVNFIYIRASGYDDRERIYSLQLCLMCRLGKNHLTLKSHTMKIVPVGTRFEQLNTYTTCVLSTQKLK